MILSNPGYVAMEIPTILKEGAMMQVMTLLNPKSPRIDQHQFSP